MIARPLHTLVRTASALAVVLAIAGCTQGGRIRPDGSAGSRSVRHQEEAPGRARAAVPQRGAWRGDRRAARSGQGLPAAAGAERRRRPSAAPNRRPRWPRQSRNQNQNPSQRSRAHPRQHRRGRTLSGARVRRLRRSSGTTRPGIRNLRLRSSRSGRLHSRRLRPSKRRSQRNRSGPIPRRPIRLRVDHFG